MPQERGWPENKSRSRGIFRLLTLAPFRLQFACRVAADPEYFRNGSTYSLPRVSDEPSVGLGDIHMPYQVRSGSFTIIAPTSLAAIKLYDQLTLTADNDDRVFINDMEGRTIDPNTLRSVISSE